MAEDGERRDALADFDASDEAMAQAREKLRFDAKAKAGDLAFKAWIVLGAYHFWMHPTAQLLSWQAAVYFIVGALVAAVVFGWFSYGAWRVALFYFTRAHKKHWLKQGRLGDSKLDAITVLAGRLIWIMQTVIIYFAAGWTLDLLYPPP